MPSRNIDPCKGDNDLSYVNNSLLTMPTLIGHNKSMSHDELLTTASMKSLYCRRLHQALILLFNCLNGTGPTYIGSLFKYRHTPYRLRGEGVNLE